MSPVERIAAGVFWVSAACIAYTYLGYPLLISLFARLFGRTSAPPSNDHALLPSLTLLIAAHNEEAVIADRLENALGLEYPRDKLEIVVASDGRSDRTVPIVRSFADRGVRLAEYRKRRGKAAVLNETMASVRGDVVVLSDANTSLEGKALLRLARWFTRREVAVACGRLVLIDPASGRNVDGVYWKYETMLKQAEGRLGALLGANGAIYAIRKDAFARIPNETIVDDFVIPLLSKLKSGGEIVYEQEAVATEATPPDIRSEFQRRARIGAGGFQSIGLLWRLLHPRWGWLAFAFFSHKVLRWISPLAFIGLFSANLLLARLPLYQAALALQGTLCLIGALGAFDLGSGLLPRLARLVTLFASVNVGLLLGLGRWLFGRQQGTWQRTVR